MAFRSSYDAHVVSVRDFDYVIPVHSSYHPAFKAAAKKRITKMYPHLRKALKQAFDNRAAKSAWGILIEDDGQPVCVVQNLACVVKNQSYRRLLRVNLNDTYPTKNFISTDTSFLTRCSHLPVGSAPVTSTRTEP
jgi:hypothetical protein